MGARVDAAGHARDHDQAALAQVGRELTGETAAVGGGVAGADDGHHALLQQVSVAPDSNQGRRVVDRGQRFGIVRLAPGKELRADLRERFQLALGRRFGTDGNRFSPAAAPGEFGQCR